MNKNLVALLAVTAAVGLLAACETLDQLAPAISAATDGKVTADQVSSAGRVVDATAKTFQSITPEQEYYIGRAVSATLLETYRPLDVPQANRYLNLCGQTLSRASTLPETFGGYHFLVLETDEVNAFGAPGGLILVSRGLIRCCRTEDELAAVLAHEIGHVENRDGLRAIRTDRVNDALATLATESARSLGGGATKDLVDNFGASVGGITSTMVNHGYSRGLEYDADRSAIKILRKTGYNPQALVDMLEHMQARLRPEGPGFGSTHPPPADRIKEIRNALGAVTPLQANPARQKRFDENIKQI